MFRIHCVPNYAEDYDDGIVCAICQSIDGDPKDPIAFCDEYDLMVNTIAMGTL